MEAKVDIKQLVIVLTGICVVAALALSGVYEGTKDKIAQTKLEMELESVEKVLPPSDKKPQQEVKEIPWKNSQGVEYPVKTYLAKVDGKLIGAALIIKEKGFGGPISLIMGVNPDHQITGLEVLSHKETPGLGGNITNTEFRKQFAGKTLIDGLSLKKDGGQIDQITGATVTSSALIKAIDSGLTFYEEKVASNE